MSLNRLSHIMLEIYNMNKFMGYNLILNQLELISYFYSEC